MAKRVGYRFDMLLKKEYYKIIGLSKYFSYREWRRDWPDEARQPVYHKLMRMVPIPAEYFL